MGESNLKSGVKWIISSGDKVGGDPVVRKQEFREDRTVSDEATQARCLRESGRRPGSKIAAAPGAGLRHYRSG